METARTAEQNSTRSTTVTVGYVIFLILWSLVGLLSFWQDRFGLFYPVCIPAWLFVAMIWYGVRKWRLRAVLIVPAITIVMCFPLLILYGRFANWELDRTLTEFIVSAKDGEIPAKFTYDGETIETLMKVFSPEYEILATDYFFGAYEYWVRFSTGAKYHFTMHHSGGIHWEVYADSYIGEP